MAKHAQPARAEPQCSATMIRGTIVLLATFLLVSPGNATATRYRVPGFGAPVLAGEKIVFAAPGVQPHRLICISKTSGDKLWEVTNPALGLQPWFAVGDQLIVTVGVDVYGCDLNSGKLKPLYRTGSKGDVYLTGRQEGSVLVQGETNDVDFLACVNTGSWRTVWKRALITRIEAASPRVLLCEQANRNPAKEGGYTLANQRWVALSREDGKLLWSCSPCATSATVGDYFLIYLKDTISCLKQADGAPGKRFKIPQKPYSGMSLAENNQRLLVNILDTDTTPMTHVHVLFSLSVPSLELGQLAQAEWESVVRAQRTHDEDYEYFSFTTPDWHNTSIVRTEFRTGSRQQLYEEPVPHKLQPKPEPPLRF
jgi:hypothetical protein